MKVHVLAIATLFLVACATTGENGERREEAAIVDFIEVNELASVDVIRTMDQLSSKAVSEKYVIVSSRRQDFLLEYYSRCIRNFDGSVTPDVRQDSRALYARVDTFRGCRIKAIYALEPGQADEVREIGNAIGGG